MALTHKITPIVDYVIQLIDDSDDLEDFDIQDVYYGDQDLIPRVPCVAVEPGATRRTLEGVPFRTLNEFEIGCLVYHSGVDGVQNIVRDCDLLAEAIAEVLNKDSLPVIAGGTNFNGYVVHGHVVSIEHGYAIRNKRLLRANRVIWQGISKTALVPS